MYKNFFVIFLFKLVSLWWYAGWSIESPSFFLYTWIVFQIVKRILFIEAINLFILQGFFIRMSCLIQFPRDTITPY